MLRNPASRRARAALFTATALAMLATGCASNENGGAPEACLVTSDVYLQALKAAPAEVRLEGETPISDCLVPSQEGGELAQVGGEMVVAATKLNAQARQDPTGSGPVELGYLIGAVSRGADSIHADLVRRLNSAARFTPDQVQSADFERQFGRGYAAGHGSG